MSAAGKLRRSRPPDSNFMPISTQAAHRQGKSNSTPKHQATRIDNVEELQAVLGAKDVETLTRGSFFYTPSVER